MVHLRVRSDIGRSSSWSLQRHAPPKSQFTAALTSRATNVAPQRGIKVGLPRASLLALGAGADRGEGEGRPLLSVSVVELVLELDPLETEGVEEGGEVLHGHEHDERDDGPHGVGDEERAGVEDCYATRNTQLETTHKLGVSCIDRVPVTQLVIKVEVSRVMYLYTRGNSGVSA